MKDERRAAGSRESTAAKMDDQHSDEQNDQKERLRARVRQLILMRETGPKSAAWHAARARLIWRLHDEIARAERAERESDSAAASGDAPGDTAEQGRARR